MSNYPNLVGVDTETAGFDPFKDSITELGSIKISPQGRVIDKFISFAKPKHSIPQTIVELTGITDDHVKDAPSPVDVIMQWREWVGNDVVILVGHNLPFDLKMLYAPLIEANQKLPRFWAIDTLEWVKKYIPYKGKGTHKLDTLIEVIGYKPSSSHRACDDALSSLKVMSYLIRKYENPKDLNELYGLYRKVGMWSNEMIPTFSKYFS
jgi:DNA polymerase-3 subunit alpha (Gram-positive type)